MHLVRSIAFSFLICLTAFGEEERILPQEVVGSVQIWLDENVEDWAFEFAGINQDALDQSLNLVQEEIQRVVPDTIAPKRQDAETLLIVLQEFSATRDYALQVHTFLDQLGSPVAPTNANSRSSSRLSPKENRQKWISVMTQRPVPAKALDCLEELKPIFQQEGLPASLVWLAEVESSFNSEGRSPVGAVGLFQLMPETARSLGLSTWFPDERRDREKNARAAARYLKYLHNRFGNWQLALAGYNAGPTRVARLLRESDAFSYAAIADRVPLETFNFVAKVEATLLVRDGFDLAKFDSPTVTASD